MNKTTTVSALFLAGAMLVSSCHVKADETVLTNGAKAVIAGIAPVVAGWIFLYSRKSEKEFKTRYSAEKTRKVSKLFTKEYATNLWYFIADEIIGQRKQSSALKVREDKKIYPSEDAPAYGLLGHADAYAAPFAESAAKFTAPFVGGSILWGYLKSFATKVVPGPKDPNAPKKVDSTEALVEATRAMTEAVRELTAARRAAAPEVVVADAAPAQPAQAHIVAPAPQADGIVARQAEEVATTV